jgi:hypothetical protein
MLRLLAEGDIERVMDQARENLLLLGVNLHYVVGQNVAPLLRATRARGTRAPPRSLFRFPRIGLH